LTKEKFKQLFDTYFEEIRRYVFYRAGDAELATDIAQETFLKVWEKQLRFLPGKEKGLLYKIAGDLFVSHYRRERSSQKYQSEFTLDIESLTPEDEIEYRELHEKYQLALSILKENQRVVFLLSRRDGLKYYEIADRLNIGVKAVEKRMKGALDILKRELRA
jgi:RNA polymerase sigma factor (sigma-70 family)